MSNRFDIYSSKVKRINIPIPEFNFFHKASSEEEVDPKFIGREQISDKLYSWLKEDPAGGSYLVTGFRGMGKSSFVGRVMNELTRKTASVEYLAGILFFLSFISCFLFHNIVCFFFLLILGLWVCCILNKDKKEIKEWRKKFLELLYEAKKEVPSEYMPKNKDIKEESVDWKRISQVLHQNYTKNRSYKRICVNVNLGQEVLNERDVLSLISHQLYTKYREYVLSPIANFVNWFGCVVILLIVILIFNYLNQCKLGDGSKGFLDCIIMHAGFCVAVSTSLLLLLIIYLIALRFTSSQISIISRLRLLNQRLDAQVTFEEGLGSEVGHRSTAKWGAGFKKRRAYHIANVREIEQELIEILDNISHGIFDNHIPEGLSIFKYPSFIFVFDELDKVDSNSISVPAGDVQAEFTNEKNFPGGGTTRRRKQNVLHLLANMKLFVSTAKAKFIFISGRELYDAYLADLSDREFAVSSIFSGVIYVDSFCVNEHKGKDVMSNVETYICKQLIPHDYVKKQYARYYAMENVNGSAFERFDINLKLYYQYLVYLYKNKVDNKVDNKDVFEKGFNEEQEEYNEDEIKAYLYRCYIDKAINLLYHFSVYLYHISNGSPKKMMLYFEKYVRACYDKGKKFQELDDFSTPNPDSDIYILSDSNPKYYLSFGYTDQRKIGFIHYLSYPINQILVNANQYSDKLLVSVSFLVDHIYKFHNGAFSLRNLEYTPELLEVYKIPGFRSFISSIISYLQQTHLIAITCGLYQFKFRKQIAEEISLASKYSEEIAALFNFTLDESLNVKQHYSEIRNTFSELEERGDGQTSKHTPRLSIGLHNILGDLYMFDEEFNNAIFEYHSAIKELEKEIDGRKEDAFPDLSNTLYYIRLLLKLGLTNEKRNTCESALLIYSELVAKLVQFRHFDEKKLQLSYRLLKNVDWPSYKGVLFPNKYEQSSNVEFSKVHPRIVNNSDDVVREDDTHFMASGQHLSAAFAHLLTPEKYSVMQRISLFQDSRLIYQALLAKLFVKEKIGLGGISITDIETIESEYIYLNLATNTSEKFLTSSDFFRRLGDIMFYKNGLTVSFYKKGADSNSKKEEVNSEENISFVEGLYYWGYDIKRELLDFCNVNKCYQHYDKLLECFLKVNNTQIRETAGKMLHNKLSNNILNLCNNNAGYSKIRKFVSLFFESSSSHTNMLKLIPEKEVTYCNRHRQEMLKCNSPVPCFACNYYSRSMRILMRGMFGCEILEERIGKNYSVFIIMEKLLVKGTSRSLRQDYVIQLAEILDCRANVLLSCVTENENRISDVFMQELLTFINSIENLKNDNSYNKEVKKLINNFEIKLKKDKKPISKLEECILYYWEASKCFSIANELIKASGSLKKVLRIFQNYLKLAEGEEQEIKVKELIFNNVEIIKKSFVRPCLIYLYSHYNNINFAEIQKLKWIFSLQSYEDIPLNRLSLYPDVEQMLLLYYDLIRRSVLVVDKLESNKDKKEEFEKILSKIYRNTTLGSLRQDSTIFERVMALRFKTLINRDLLSKIGLKKDLYYYKGHEEVFVKFFLDYVSPKEELNESLGELRDCFRFVFLSNNNDNGHNQMEEKLYFLEFLIKDSLFCLTRILEIITPHTSSTLFSNSFYGEIYQMLYEWYMIFDELFMTYKYMEKSKMEGNEEKSNLRTYSNLINEFSKIENNSKNGNKIHNVKSIFKKLINGKVLYSERFFNETTHEIGKAQANYTFAKYTLSMAKESYERALQMHHEGKAYKDMISQMYYLDDDLKNDTIQFGMAIERYKINNRYIQKQLANIQRIIGDAPMYEIENFVDEKLNAMKLNGRFYLQGTQKS